MIERLLPAEVASVSRRDDDPSAQLRPEEAVQFGWAVERRALEVATARACARQALGILGLSPSPILRGAAREPLWPKGVVGSITHCAGYRAAAVARATKVIAIGIDAELHEPLPDGVSDRVLVAAERIWSADAPAGIHWERLIFSAKESVFKAWYPLTGRWLDFNDAVVTLDLGDETFSARFRGTGPVIAGRTLAEFRGRFLICEDLILTCVTMLKQNWFEVSTVPV